MPDQLDFGPATQRMAQLIAAVPADRLDARTPCDDYSLGDLIDHVGGLTVAFTRAATKDLGEAGSPPLGDASRLGDDWKARITADLDRLAEAWRGPDAWTGMTRAGGIDMPGDVAAFVAIDELLVHGWDVAKASGQPFDADADSITAALSFVEQFSGPDDAESRGDAFGPVIHVPDDAPRLDRLIGLTGRDPGWSPA
jgi:uncharacterized protein (TIGR03086 family)